MTNETIINESSTSRILRGCPTSEALEEIEKFVNGLKQSKEAKIDTKSVTLGEKVKCEFEISERNDGRKSIEIELEW